MRITKESVAGTVESSDVMVYVAPSGGGVDAVALRLDDRGALDCVLRARLKAALLRATDEPVDWGKVL